MAGHIYIFFVPVQPTVFLHYNFFEDHLNITCSATARPAPMISWKVAGSGIENSTESLLHPNGTTSVTSILRVKDPKSQVGKEVICQVLYQGTVTDYRQTLNKGKRRRAKMAMGTSAYTQLEGGRYPSETFSLSTKEITEERELQVRKEKQS